MSILEKLRVIQAKLNAPKNQFNKFGNYKYRSCEDIQEAVKPLLDEVGAVLIVGDELLLIGTRYYIKATANLVDPETGEVANNSAFAREEETKKGMDGSQITGSASSYARKYALNGLFCIDDVKDADIAITGKPPVKKTPSVKEEASEIREKITEAMIKTILAQLDRTGLSESKILELYKIKKLTDMDVVQFKPCMSRFKSTPDKKEVSA